MVTGASRGIGRAVADRLAASGYAIAVHAHTEASAQRAAAGIAQAYGVPVLPVYGDVADAGAVKLVARQVFDRFRRLDALVVNAGIHDAALLGMMSAAAVERLFAVNAVGAAHTLQSCVSLLRRAPGPAVVLVSSVLGSTGAPGQAIYAASKAALLGLARSAAKELGPAGIRVNAVAPGFIDTDLLATLDDQQRKERVGQTALGRLGTPQDVAEAVTFLLTAGFVTGQVLGVDGGLVI
ncbi:MAG TPA: SDR family oxidoreductase [Catenuloplanes sp.]